MKQLNIVYTWKCINDFNYGDCDSHKVYKFTAQCSEFNNTHMEKCVIGDIEKIDTLVGKYITLLHCSIFYLNLLFSKAVQSNKRLRRSKFNQQESQ